MKEVATKLVDTVDATFTRLSQVDDSAAARRSPGGGWSAKEVVGHMIDSALINHQRFVRGAHRRHLVFEGYDQNEWVETQRYQDRSWTELLGLWRLANHHLAAFAATLPVSVSMRECPEHNLHEVGWQPFSRYQPVTLDAFFIDYVGHLEHHVKQIDGLLGG